MARNQVEHAIPLETIERFSESKWPDVLSEWAGATVGNENWRTELVPDWEGAVNDPYPLLMSGRSPSLEQREILKAMGLVETPRMKFRTWFAFSLFAPPEADWDFFASRVKFTEAGLDLIESAGAVA